jgi:hypothetical protein
LKKIDIFGSKKFSFIVIRLLAHIKKLWIEN